VMLASALRDYLTGYGVSVGDRTVVVTNNDDAYLTALALVRAGLSVPAIVDARDGGAGVLGEVVEYAFQNRPRRMRLAMAGLDVYRRPSADTQQQATG
ncbi:MAG: hypothetical protein VXW43_17560, partial [Pseudomonadota bacterium]|nr:hypothetical protein [Pseudomonadota bacterium]